MSGKAPSEDRAGSSIPFRKNLLQSEFDKLDTPQHVNGFEDKTDMGKRVQNPAPAREKVISDGPRPESSDNAFSQTPNQGSFEPIAIIGLSLRCGGDAKSSAALWKLLMEGRSTMTEVPRSRFNIDAFHGKAKDGLLYQRGAHFLEDDIASFDAPFFSLSPLEASSMDPQQRLLLETSYEALENAGITLEDARGSNTSVHVGCSSHDYEVLLSRDPHTRAKYKATGTAQSLLSNRISWFYDLCGPSMTIDTACSSSLTALHVACQGLRCGDASMALVGGASLVLNFDTTLALGQLDLLSPDSRSYSFDSRANGYSRGEGFGFLVLKPLSKAVEHGDTIRAVIRGSYLNQDGHTSSVVQPNLTAQKNMIRSAYKQAGLEMNKTRYFETHGTGTVIGDSVEAEAISSAFRGTGNPSIYLGAVKSNIGHLEAASGIAGIIKAVMVLEKAIIPPNYDFRSASTRIPLEKWKLRVPNQIVSWPDNDTRRASISGLGFGGANSHVILDDAYNYLRLHNISGNHNTVFMPPGLGVESGAVSTGELPSSCDAGLADPRLIVWSAPDRNGLERLVALHQVHLKSLALTERENDYVQKAFQVLRSLSDLDQTFVKTPSNQSKVDKSPKLAFVFTGQGAQWPRMGLELVSYLAFKQSLEIAEDYFHRLGAPWSLRAELEKSLNTSNLDKPGYAQPICTALQVALVDLLHSWGIHPAAVVSHSSGEIAAAYCGGAISREAAYNISYYRGVITASLIQVSSSPGAMLVVELSQLEAERYLKDSPTKYTKVSVACINSPTNVTLSGDGIQIEELYHMFFERDIFTRRLKTGVAYHTKTMEQVSQTYMSLIGEISTDTSDPSLSSTVILSSVTGQRIAARELRKTRYWADNLVSPVQFFQAVSNITLAAPTSKSKGSSGIFIDHLIEIGPHSALQGPLRQTFQSGDSDGFSYSSVLIRGQSALSTSLTVAGNLYCLGCAVDIDQINRLSSQRAQRKVLTDLPSYPFNRSKTFWTESRISREFRNRVHPPHELLGIPSLDWSPLEARWQNIINIDVSPWIKDHKVNGAYVYPGAGMLVMAIEAIRQIGKAGKPIRGYRFKNVFFEQALVVPAQGSVEVQFIMRPSQEHNISSAAWTEFRLYKYENNDWALLSKGSVALDLGPSFHDNPEDPLLESVKEYSDKTKDCRREVSVQGFYRDTSQVGFEYGPSLRGIKSMKTNDYCGAIATVDLCGWMAADHDNNIHPHVIHPAGLDAIFQVMFGAVSKDGLHEIQCMVPTMIQEMWIGNLSDGTYVREGVSGSCSSVKVRATAEAVGIRHTNAFLVAVESSTGLPCVIGGIQTTAVADFVPQSSKARELRHFCYRVERKPDISILNEAQIRSYCSIDPYPASLLSKEVARACQEVSYLALLYAWQSLDTAFESSRKGALQRYTGWMERHISDFLSKQTINSQLENADSAVKAELDSRYPILAAGGAVARTISRVAQNLPDIMNGHVNALELLFQDNLMNKYYSETSDFNSSFMRLLKYIELCAHKNPTLKVLEIGAGTGGATTGILRALSNTGLHLFSSYDFTDVSPSFFEAARERFSEYDEKLNYTVFDIEADPSEQGIHTGTYDIVIASHILHATKSVHAQLRNIRTLLKPSGKLLINEYTTTDSLTLGFVFGLLDGWWLAGEDYRTEGPLLNVQSWHEHLLANDFSGVDVCFDEGIDDSLPLGTIMISTANQIAEEYSNESKTTLVIADNSSALSDLLNALNMSNSTPSVYETIPFSQISSHDFAYGTAICLVDLEEEVLCNLDATSIERLKTLISFNQRIVWVSKAIGSDGSNPRSHLVDGFARTVEGEASGLKFVTLKVEDLVDTARVVHSIKTVLESTPLGYLEESQMHYEEEGSNLTIDRIVAARDLDNFIQSRIEPPESEASKLGKDIDSRLKLSIGSPGLLDTFRFVDDDSANMPMAPGEAEVKVASAGLNFRDVLIALGQEPDTCFGVECSGTITQVGPNTGFQIGDRVCCFARSAISRSVRATAVTTAKIPDNMGMNEAAGFIVVFATAYYALTSKANLRPRESILIHSAAGGFGQACVQIAILCDAEIYATVGNERKKAFLVEEYGLDGDHIFSSRTLEFADRIRAKTAKSGVDVVVNSSTGETLRATWSCIAPFGRFIEVGKKDMRSGGILPMDRFLENTSFIGVDILGLAMKRGDVFKGVLGSCFTLFNEGKISLPRPLTVFGASQIEDAFRFLQDGKSIGKIVIELHDDDEVQVVPSIKPTYKLDPSATYIIAGGLGGIGRSIARWMVRNNAKHLVLLGRSKERSSAAQALLEELESKAIQVAALSCDISDASALKEVLTQCEKSMPPVKGCFQATMVIEDQNFQSVSAEAFNAVLKPKVRGSWNLHNLLPKGMDFFVLLSSLSGIIGTHGQSSYASGNSFQDALARHRLKCGEKAVSIDLGLMTNIGYVAEYSGPPEKFSYWDQFTPVEEKELLAVLEYFCDPSLTLPSLASSSQVLLGLDPPSHWSAKGLDIPLWASRPTFSHVATIKSDTNVQQHGSTGEQTVAYDALLRKAQSLAEAGEIVAHGLRAKLSRTFAMPEEDVDIAQPLQAYGIDSLTAIEVRTWFRRVIGAELAIFELLGKRSIAALAEMAAGKSVYVGEEIKGEGWM